MRRRRYEEVRHPIGVSNGDNHPLVPWRPCTMGSDLQRNCRVRGGRHRTHKGRFACQFASMRREWKIIGDAPAGLFANAVLALLHSVTLQLAQRTAYRCSE